MTPAESARETLDDKLARISARLDERREKARAALATEPGLLELCDQLRDRFGGRLTWVKTADFELGTEPPRGIVPVPYRPPTTSRRGQADARRARERLGR